MKSTEEIVVLEGRPYRRVPGEYSDTLVAIGPDRPEPSDAERARKAKDDQIDYPDLLREYRWSANDFDYLKTQPGFPLPLGWRAVGWNGGRQTYYSREQLRSWAARYLEFARKVEKVR